MQPGGLLTDARLAWLERLLDRAFRIPGTNVRIGLDALVGLVPVVGDTATAIFSGLFIVAAISSGARWPVVAEMVWNVVVDWLLGAVPVLGDLFDVVYQANTRNLALLRAELAYQRAQINADRSSESRS